jgi:heme/copper-type cytochrome/quinol oxidase subunit 4
MRLLTSMIWAAGRVQLIILAANFVMPEKLRCSENLARVSPMIRQVFIVHRIYIPVVLAIFTSLCFWFAPELAGASRMGQEPIVLLTAVHFHYAGFAAPLLARSTRIALARSRMRTKGAAFLNSIAVGVLVGPGMLAAGLLIGPRVKLAAALVLALSEVGLALFFLFALRHSGDPRARLLIAVTAGSIVFSVVLSALWAVGEYPLQPFVHLAEMARLHGTANAFGFTLCGLLGWVRATTTMRAREGSWPG